MSVHVPGYSLAPLRMMSHERLYSKANKTLPMNPPTQGGELRVILKWGEHPQDLDLHGVSSNNEHVYYWHKESHASSSLGLKWLKFSAQWARDTEDKGLCNPLLAEALTRQTELTQQEWNAFGITQLRKEDFIKSGDSYLKPAANFRLDKGTPRHGKDVWRAFKLLADATGRPRVSVINEITSEDRITFSSRRLSDEDFITFSKNIAETVTGRLV
jgi:hypothetical protein